jgi:acyl-CoA thioester hydrolase
VTPGHLRPVVDVEVRWADQDPLGHVNHAVAVELIAEARLRWLGRQAVAEGYADFAPAKMVASLSVDYRTPIEYGVPLSVAMAVDRVGTKSYTLSYRATQHGRTRFVASTVIVPRGEDGGSRAVTAQERAYLERYRADQVCSTTTS